MAGACGVRRLAGGREHALALWQLARLSRRLVDKAEAKLDLFDHLGGHSSRNFTDLLSGSLASRISSTGDSVQQVLSIVLFNIAPVCADFCAALVILATVGWRLVTALGLFVLVAVGTLAPFGQRGMPRHRAYADRAAEVGGALVDVVSNIWAVKTFAAQSRERWRFAQLLNTEATTHRNSRMYIERMRVLHDSGLWLMAGGMLIWSLYLWSKGRISPGDVILTVAVAFRILHCSRDLAFAAVNASQFISRIADAIQVIGEDHIRWLMGPARGSSSIEAAASRLRMSISPIRVDATSFAASPYGSSGDNGSVWWAHPGRGNLQ